MGSRNEWSQTDLVNAFRVGKSWSWQALSTNSLIDDVTIWSHDLTAEEINQLYQGADPASVTPAPAESPLYVLDFEGGLPPEVTVTGAAFTGQPTTSLRHDFFPHGSHFIGTYEDGLGDGPTGELVTDGFVLSANTIRFRIGGGHNTDTALELQRWNGTDWVTVRRDLGHARAEVGTTPQVGERMAERQWNVGDLIGETVRFRGVDGNSGGWGHINFDYIRVLDEARPQSVQTDFDQPTMPAELSTYIPLRGGIGQEARAGLNAPNSTYDFNLEPSGGLNWDLWATADRAPQLRMPVDANDQCFTLETHMSARSLGGTSTASSTGLVLDYADFQNGNKDAITLAAYTNDGLRAEGPYAGARIAAPDLSGTTVDDVWLRVENRYGDYRFSYSLDGTDWVRMGDRRHSNDLLYAGLFAKTWSGAAAQSSQFDTFSFQSLKRSDLLQRITFEDGTLPAGWTTTGTAFNNQPTSSTRTEFYKQGDWFIGTYEDGNTDAVTGTLTGTSFVLQGNTIRALVGGGGHDTFGSETQLQLERQMGDGSWRVVRSDSGSFSNEMREVAWNVGDLVGQNVRFKVADNNAGGWGQVIVDDIRELAERRPTHVRDDFDNDITSPDVMVYRPFLSPGAETTAAGTFQFDIPGGGYDLWAGVNASPQLQIPVSHEDQVWVLETHMPARDLTPAEVNASTGIVLNFTDLANGNKDPVGFGPYRNDGIRAEGPFFGVPGTALTGTTVDDIFLRVERRYGKYTFSYSTDGTTWTDMGSRWYGKDLTSIGLFAKSWGGAAVQMSQFEYLDFQSLARVENLQRWDFEDGQFPAGWTTTGTAFGNQPTASNRGWGGQSGLGKQGEYFIGTYEDGNGDGPTGELISAPFEVTANTMRLKIGGGGHIWYPGRAADYTAVLLEREVSPGNWEPVRYDSGRNSEIMREIHWNLSPLMGETVRLRVADLNGGGWGHINVDDIRINDEVRPAEFHTGFDGPVLEPQLIVHEPYGNPTVSVADGKLTLHLDNATYDNWTYVDNAPSIRLPIDAIASAETHVDVDYTGGTAFHTGLMVYFDNYDGLYWGIYGDQGLRLELPGIGNAISAVGAPVDDVSLRVERDGDVFSFLYRLPGDGWTLAGTYTHGGDPLYAGMFAKSWGGHPTSLDANFSFFDFVAVPEPSSIMLLAVGLAGLALFARRRRRG